MTKEEGEESAKEVAVMEPWRGERLKLAEVGDEEVPVQVGIDPMNFFFCASMKKEICASVEQTFVRYLSNLPKVSI